MRTCRKCGYTLKGKDVELFFRSNPHGGNDSCPVRSVCIGCELTARTKAKENNRELEKAKRTLRHHGAHYVQKGKARSVGEFARLYGWDIHRMAHDIRHAFQNSCSYCRTAFSDRIDGLGGITLDIVDPYKEPYYKTNVLWVCQTCNAAKQKTAPEDWERKQYLWQDRDQWMRSPHRPVQLELAMGCL